MPHRRRLTAALAAVAPVWALLTVVVAAPVAHADTAGRAPHDPAAYYASAVGLSGTALANELHDIIDGNTSLPYTASTTDVWDALSVLDADPNDGTKLIDFYSGEPLLKTNTCNPCGPDENLYWNREHTWPQSHGVDLDAGVPAGTDLFHLRPSRPNSNSSRGDLDFDESVNPPGYTVPGCTTACARDNDSFEPREAIKGDLARGLFYLVVRYNGGGDGAEGDLVMVETIPSSGFTLGKLSTLVGWSLADPPDNAERTRNDLIDSDYQHNRNPFIDHPEWVCSIWGSSVPASTCANPPNGAPAATAATGSTPEDTPRVFTLTASDPDGDPLTYAVGAPSHGSVSLSGNQATYTPDANRHGPDSFTFTASDATLTSAPATVSITVDPVNDAPTAAQGLTASTPTATAKQITLAGSDVDGDSLTYAIATQPAHGSVSLTGSTATYTSTAGYVGPDSFTYTVEDPANATSAPATVDITVTQQAAPPVATAVTVSTDEDQAKTFTLTATDPNGDTLNYGISVQPTHGTVSLAGNQATYTPDTNYNGPDAFGWTVSDGSPPISSTASITVNAVNDVPVASAGTKTTAEDTVATVALVAADVEGQTLGYAVTQPQHGSVSLAGGQATYTPAANYAGPDSFTFTASDGSSTSVPATVSVTVSPVNDAPTVNAAALATTFGSPVTASLAAADVDGDAVTVIAATTPAHGSVAYAGRSVTYSPTAAGSDAFVVTVTDGHGAIATGQVGVDVAKAAPTLKMSPGSLKAGKPGTIKVKLTGVAGVAPTGKVKLKVDGRTLTMTLKKGIATFNIAELPDVPKLKVKATYLGDRQYAAGSAKKTLTLT